jgi:hypothetical protein
MKRCMCNACVRSRHGSRHHYSYTQPCIPRPRTFNDAERERWIANDEGLYNWQRTSGLSMTRFIRSNRMELDELIRAALKGDG